MSSPSLPVVQSSPSIPPGTPQFESLRRKYLDEFASKVPRKLVLPQELIDNAPKNVTGIPASCGLLSPEELDITESYDVTALAEAIAAKRLTAVAVATAFAKRAIIAHQLTCCLMEWFMDEALARAHELDEYLETTGKTVGPLHGVPVSIKEHISIKGHYSMFGFWDTREVAEEDSHVVSILRNAGAIFYCKTLQPQAFMHLETASFYGRTLNPHNIQLTPGGSTGGEAALIAMRGSLLGVGTDIGGSVRGPSAFCGIFGFKPTSYTSPMKGSMGSGVAAELNILVSMGPMCSSLRDMDLFMSVMSAAKPFLEDPRIIPIPWSGLSMPRAKATPLKIGFMMNDGVIEPQPPVTRALQWARTQLTSHGSFEIKEFKPFKVAEAIRNIRLAYWPDGARALKAHIRASGEPMLPLTEWVIQDAEGEDIGASGVLHQRLVRDDFRSQFAKHWTLQDVDVVICPAFVGPACAHETAWYWNYTAFWNYVDYPGAVLPTLIKASKKGVDTYATEMPLSDQCRHVRELWEDGDFEGAPINIQVCARKYHDNELFAALGAMKEALGIQL